MSLRSSVKRSKACSMAAVSVLWSTTRKFFCESGAGVTCLRVLALATGVRLRTTHANSSQQQPGHRVLFSVSVTLRLAVLAAIPRLR
jgi:hypothetical protein